MRSLVLSFFDGMRGPLVFLASPSNVLPKVLARLIPGFMDVYERGFFISVEEGVTIANTIFEIPSDIARGHKELLQVSVVLNEEGINAQLAGLLNDLLDKFAKYCQQLPDLYLAFYPKMPDSSEKNQELTKYFMNFSEIIQSTIKTMRETDLSYQMIFKKAREGIVLIDYKTGQFIDANHKAERILKRTLDNLRGKTLLDMGLRTDEDIGDLRRKIFEQIQDEDLPPIKSYLYSPEKHKIPVEICANKIHIWDRDIVQVIFREITSFENIGIP